MGEPKRFVISVDMGTSSVRACLVDTDLDIIHQSQLNVALQTDVSGKAEQDADEIIEKTLQCILDVIAWAESETITIDALSFSNTVSSLVALDNNFQPVGMVITYADTRSDQHANRLREEEAELFRFSACPVHASYWPAKLLWLKHTSPDFLKSNYFCTIKDLLIFCLCEAFLTDYSNAVATGMCDVRSGDWNSDLLQRIGVTRDQLPAIVSSTYVLQTKKSQYFDYHIPMVIGATDGVLSSLGAGAFDPGQVTTMVGSSGACRIAAISPLIDDVANLVWSYPLDDEIWIRGGAMNNGGLVLQWASQTFYQGAGNDDKLAAMLGQAEKIAPGAEGLVFLPYIYGERAPIWNANARGVFFGIHATHQPGHFFRATIEGILFSLYSIYQVIRANEYEAQSVRASGGYSQSDLMLQAQADLFGQRVDVPDHLEGSAIGAAALAFKAIGRFEDYREIDKKIRISRSFIPNLSYKETYQVQYRQFGTLYQHLKALMVNSGIEK